MRCEICGKWLAPMWAVRCVEWAGIIILLVLIAFFSSACSTMSICTPEGYEAHYARLGNQDISGLRFERDPNGLYRITLDKQSSDATEVLGTILKGLLK